MATVLTLRRCALVCAGMLWLQPYVAPSFSSASASGTARAQDLPTLTQPVNDFANVIDPDSEAELDRRIRALQRTTGDVVIVTTVNTIAPFGTIEEYAVRLFERAGIGERKQDNGLLILVAVQDRRVRIEVGYDLEEFVTDGYAGDTIRQMLPAFRDGRYGSGLVAGTTRIIRRIGEGRGREIPELPPPAPRPAPEREAFPWFPLVVIGIVILLRIMRIGGGPPGMHRRRRGWTWSGWNTGVGGFGGGWMGGGFGGGGFGGGSGGGGFGGFGGGRSGGGGASGGW